MCSQILLSVWRRNVMTLGMLMMNWQAWRGQCSLSDPLPLHLCLLHWACSGQHQPVVRKWPNYRIIEKWMVMIPDPFVLVFVYWHIILLVQDQIWTQFNNLLFLPQVCFSLSIRRHPWTLGSKVTAHLIMLTSPSATCQRDLTRSCSTQSWTCRSPAQLQPAVHTVLSEITLCCSADPVRTLSPRWPF